MLMRDKPSSQSQQVAQSLPWTTWENQHAATAFPLILASG